MALTNYFESINSDGHIIINDSFKNLSLMEEFHITELKSLDEPGYNSYKNYPDRTFVKDGEGNYWLRNEVVFTIKVADQSQILSLYIPNSNIGIYCHRVVNTYVLRAIFFKSMDSTDFVNALKQIVFRIYGYDGTPSTQNVGLQIFNASGNLLFDSNKKYLHVVDFKNTYVAQRSQLHLCSEDELASVGEIATFRYQYSVPVECACFSPINFLQEDTSDGSLRYESIISFPSSSSIDVCVVPYRTSKEYLERGFISMLISMLILQR